MFLVIIFIRFCVKSRAEALEALKQNKEGVVKSGFEPEAENLRDTGDW